MSDSDDSDDQFNFKSTDNFDLKQEQKETQISNEQHFHLLTDICNKFYTDLQSHDDFNHKITWRTYSNLEPIRIQINSNETFPGVCDLIKSNNKLYSKILIAIMTDIYQVENFLPNMGYTQYESLYPLSIYGEKIENETKGIDSNEETYISYMLPYLNDVYERILNLLTIATNLLSQLLSLYTCDFKNKTYYQKEFRTYNFDLPFEYLGKILSYFLAIDAVVSGNDYIKADWDKYRTMFHRVKSNPSEYNMNEEQKKKLDKLIKRINAPIFENTCYKQCVGMILDKAGETTPSGSGIIKASQNRTFFLHLTNYLKKSIGKIYQELDSFSESYERIHLFQYLGLFGLYMILAGPNCDKNLLKNVWGVQKKVTKINIVGISTFKISTFLLNYREFRGLNLEPADPLKYEIENLLVFERQIGILISNIKLDVMTWISRLDSDIFGYKVNITNDKRNQISILQSNTLQKVTFIITGLSLSNYLRRIISNILNIHLNNGLNITPELISQLTTGIELIKVIESQFYKIMPRVAQNLNVMNRVLLELIQKPLQKVQETLNIKFKEKKANENQYLYMDQLTAIKIFQNCCSGIPSNMRILISKMCLNTLSGMNILDEKTLNAIKYELWRLEILNNLSREIKRTCDCSFLYLYQDIIPISLESIYNNDPISLYYYSMALNDIEKPLMYIKYRENNGFTLVQLLRKNIMKILEDKFLIKLCNGIEDDLRKQIHRVFIEGLNPPAFSEVNLNNHLKIRKFKLFDCIMDIKRFVEEYMNMTFYKMTTLNLNDWQTYQQMRVLAKHRYGLNLHEIFLPSQNLEKGKDILDIIRNLKTFTKKYTHNLNNQIFIEIVQDGQYVNVLGAKQILNSLYTHGTGIVNSIVNKAFNYISKTIKPLLNIIFDDYIISMLKDESRFWNENKSKINYNYPLERASNLRKKILSLDDNKKETEIQKTIQAITQIGNAIALARCIRTALMDYNSQNSKLLTNDNINDYNQLAQQISLQVEDIDPNDADNNNNSSNISSNLLNNIQNSLNECNKTFCETINNLKQIGKNTVNYLEILVSSFGDSVSSTKIPEIELFSFLIPPITLTFIDNAINARDNLMKKNKTEEGSYFSDDGFMVGICYLLKIFSCDKKFESLNWFPSVLSTYKNKQNSKPKNNKSSFGLDTLEERQTTAYKEQFEILYFTYTSATILFTE